MNKIILNTVSALSLAALPFFAFAQAPTLGVAGTFVLFTTTGAVTNTGTSQITGNVGTNNGSSTGFGNVNGRMENNNGTTAAAAADLLNAYNQLDGTAAAFFPAGLLGNGDTLHAGVYEISGNATINLNLNLDADNNPNAVFIIRVDGTLSAAAGSSITLLDGAKACNVFWQVEGMISMASLADMKGNFIANNAAITMSSNSTLEGRALSTTGAIGVSNVLAYIPTGCGSPVLTGPAAAPLGSTACYALLTANGPLTNSGISTITGDVGTNVGLTTGFNPLLVNGMIHPIPDGSTSAASADLLNLYDYLNDLTVDIELLYPAQFGNSLVLTPHVYLLDGAASLTDTLYLNAEGNANAVFVIMINGALSTSTFATVVLTNGTQAKNVFWKVEGATEINDFSKFKGTLVGNNGAISLNTGVELDGRALTTNGSFLTNAVNVAIPSSCQPVQPGSGFTINQTQPASATNFISFTAFSAYLDANGVSAPMVVEVVTGTGPYLERVQFNPVTGSNATNTITLLGNDNVLRALTNRKALYVMRINGTDFLTISNLMIESAPGSPFGWGIHLKNDARNVTIQNSTITVDAVSTLQRDFMGIVATSNDAQYQFPGNNVTNLHLVNNIVNGGFMGIRINGNQASYTKGTLISGNTVNNAWQHGISLTFNAAPVVSQNVVMMRNGNLTSWGIVLEDNAGGSVISRNRISNSGTIGLHLLRSSGTATKHLKVTNNMIGGFQSTTEANGIVIGGTSFTDLYFNSVNVNTGAIAAGLYVHATSKSTNIRNNSLAYTGTGGGYAMFLQQGATFTAIDYNNYYSGGSKLVRYNNLDFNTLAALQLNGATGFMHDQNSRQGNPNYSSTTNLHSSGTQLSNGGIALADVTVDFDGETRTATPDMGADEFASSSRLAGTGATGTTLTAAVYPNPVMGNELTLEAFATKAGTLQLTITDLLGRIVKQQSALVTEGTYRQLLTLPAGMNSGLYILTVQQNGEQSQIKFRKQ